MKFVSATIHNESFIGLLYENKVIDLHKAEKDIFEITSFPETLFECVALGDKFIQDVQQIVDKIKEDGSEGYLYPLQDIKINAPITKPTKNIYCVGKNYQEHVIEMGSVEDIPKHVMLFSKAPTTIIGHDEEIDPHLHITNELDYEGELAVVIGKKGKRIREEDAMDYVFGYTIVNDVTARNLQAQHKQFLLGKSLDTSCPMGPYLVHKSTIKNPYQLSIKTKVNDEIRQNGNTKDMIFSIEHIISTISQGTTLEPGDIIATGTPSGVGKGFNPPKFLTPGDIVEIEIEEIGILKNKIMV
ncbi:2-keto-4-pentenoate hydratase/2-oxohepta-3-ene-1,7-dioic acid hydratase in catechol pathway [Metabacillus crassostreae]|uniref:fumarylacetoacetate hydrolase family protein n=1 Tax=Metabacillus crassostreae TaxID=929098 RepID=UPI0019592710|nr:fumarylacetoacetate hydrolase family protein [Metabacillus crassostreae]MBM7604136.1 2-keto-4-pentenoate hydratase/2-oxohepta-3-ene-1,7-dioic acid hydratase in catechol pathway [Metabacillus crassostreae]